MGKIAADGSSKDVDAFITATKGIAMPPSGQAISISGSGNFDGADGTGISAGETIIFGTTTGSTSDPSGLIVQVEIDPDPTAGLEMNYLVIGA